MKPPCHNRPPFAEGRWHDTGRRTDEGKPIYRWHWRWFTDRCATHEGVGIGPNGENYPAAHGWNCFGCRHDPRRNILGVTIVEDPSVPPGMIALSVPYSIGKSESAVRFFYASGDMNFLPDDGTRWRIVEVESTNDIDAFEPIQRAKRPSTWN